MIQFQPITRRIAHADALSALIRLLPTLPWHAQLLEVVIRPVAKKRSLDQNALYWAGPLKDIEQQAWVNDRQYSAELWHEYFKQQYMPEANDPDIDRLVKSPEKYNKWDYMPSGERICVASTTKLTKYGFSQYLTAVQAEAAQMGVMLRASPNEVAA